MYNLTEPCIVAPGWYKAGYKLINRHGPLKLAHRFSYIMTYGPPPPDKPFILHKCNNKACWNPSHLYSGTNADNSRDMIDAGVLPNSRKTHCPKGHLYNGNNLVNDSRPGRRCKTCARESTRVRRALKRVSQ